MKYILKRHPFSLEKNHDVVVKLNKKKDSLDICFEVSNKLNKWNTDKSFDDLPMRNWGLWENDVVEVFLQPRSTKKDYKAPYLELQVSPLNQRFQLFIFDPRKVFFTPLVEFFASTSIIENNKWTLNFSIPKFWDEKNLYVGLFACLGKKREFYSANLNKESRPDFHRPDLFINV
jgi:hypothetical protein